MKKRLLILMFVGLIACDDIIEVVDISKDTVAILAPVNESIIDTTSVIFTWEAMEQVDTYHLQVAKPTFHEATQIMIDTMVVTSFFKGTLDVGNYEWRINAKNSDYETTYVTQSFSVTD